MGGLAAPADCRPGCGVLPRDPRRPRDDGRTLCLSNPVSVLSGPFFFFKEVCGWECGGGGGRLEFILSSGLMGQSLRPLPPPGPQPGVAVPAPGPSAPEAQEVERAHWSVCCRGPSVPAQLCGVCLSSFA